LASCPYTAKRVCPTPRSQTYADRADDADTLVLVELVPDELTTSEPDSVALYLREFDRLRSAAVSATKPAPCSIA